MNLKFIRTIQDFEESKKIICTAFDQENRLPKQVFKPNFGNFLFNEFDRAMGSSFWETFQQLVFASQDSYILTAVLEPSPTGYFYKEFGYYNWCRLPANSTADDYWNALELGPKESPADAMLYNSEVIVWVSPSMKWAVWGERSYGICILAFDQGSNIITKIPILKSWWSVETALIDLLPINFKGELIPKEFSDSLRFSYSIPQSR